jgi:CubicO group peptidase (beta-lactamase class C family)
MRDDASPVAERGNADISNWRTLPFSRWAFRNVGEIIPCAEVDNEPGNVTELAAASRSLAAFRLAAEDGATFHLDQFCKATTTDALVILLNGKIVHEFYDHGMTQHTRHILMSASKSVVGLVAGILNQRGVLDSDARVADLLPEIAGTAYGSATLRQLLDMRTGVVFNKTEQRAYNLATNWDPIAPGEPPMDLRQFFVNMTASAKSHGGPFRYVSANTDLLGWAIERATGKTFAALLSDLLWKPMGAADRASITLDRQGLARCTGGICATARDFARVGQLLVQNGRRADEAIIPPEWIDDILDNGDRQAWATGEWSKLFAYRSMSYRGGWYVVDDKPGMMFAMGIHGQNLFVDRANRLVIAKLSSQGAAVDVAAWRLTHRAVAEVRRCLLGQG